MKHGWTSVARPIENLVHLGGMLSVDFHKSFQDFTYFAFRGCWPGQVDVDAISQDAGARSSLFSELSERRSGMSSGIWEPLRFHDRGWKVQ